MDGITKTSKYDRVIDLPRIIAEREAPEQILEKKYIYPRIIKDYEDNSDSIEYKIKPEKIIKQGNLCPEKMDISDIDFQDTGVKVKPLKYEKKVEVKDRSINWKLIFMKVIVYLIKKLTLGFVSIYHLLYDKMKKIEYHGVNNLDVKRDKKQLFLLSISLPKNVNTAEIASLCYPMISRSKIFEILKIKKNQFERYNKVFSKND